MKTSKEFDKWQEAQEAIRAWCKENQDKPPPDWMCTALRVTETAYREAKEDERTH